MANKHVNFKRVEAQSAVAAQDAANAEKQIARAIVQKREQYTMTFAAQLVRGRDEISEAHALAAVDLAVKMADRVLEKVFDIKPKEGAEK